MENHGFLPQHAAQELLRRLARTVCDLDLVSEEKESYRSRWEAGRRSASAAPDLVAAARDALDAWDRGVLGNEMGDVRQALAALDASPAAAPRSSNASSKPSDFLEDAKAWLRSHADDLHPQCESEDYVSCELASTLAVDMCKAFARRTGSAQPLPWKRAAKEYRRALIETVSGVEQYTAIRESAAAIRAGLDANDEIIDAWIASGQAPPEAVALRAAQKATPCASSDGQENGCNNGWATGSRTDRTVCPKCGGAGCPETDPKASVERKDGAK